MMMQRWLISLIVTFEAISVVGQDPPRRRTCRDQSLNTHQRSLWEKGFPYSNEQIESGDFKLCNLCDGTVTVETDPELSICVEGRVTYSDINRAVKDYRSGLEIHSPAARSISVNGHMVAGSANVILGPSARFLYDFVTKYTVDGVEYAADNTMLDRMLAASKGTIDGFCLNGTAFTTGPSWYRISRDYRTPLYFTSDMIDSASQLYISTHSIFVEFHRAVSPNWLFSYVFFPFSWLGMAINNFAVNLPIPAGLVSWLPGFLGFTGLIRAFLVNGHFRTQDFPHPLIAPDLDVENWQIDTAWSTLQAAIDDGLFTRPLVPINVGVIIKRILPQRNTNGCWTEPTAAIDIQNPIGQSGPEDTFVLNTLYPMLAEHGAVSVHYGKRVVSNTDPLFSSLDFFAACGVETNLDLNISNCYHPLCRRDGSVTNFEYPEPYYDIIERGTNCKDIIMPTAAPVPTMSPRPTISPAPTPEPTYAPTPEYRPSKSTSHSYEDDDYWSDDKYNDDKYNDDHW